MVAFRCVYAAPILRSRPPGESPWWRREVRSSVGPEPCSAVPHGTSPIAACRRRSHPSVAAADSPTRASAHLDLDDCIHERALVRRSPRWRLPRRADAIATRGTHDEQSPMRVRATATRVRGTSLRPAGPQRRSSRTTSRPTSRATRPARGRLRRGAAAKPDREVLTRQLAETQPVADDG